MNRCLAEYVEDREVDRGRSGGVRTAPTVVCAVHAEMRPLSARETLMGAGVGTEITHRLKTRWRPEIKSTGHFLINGRKYQIASALNVGGDDMWLDCLLIEKG